jgi:hypothetical protein
MAQDQEPVTSGYPLGRGYGHDYMRGGEVFGGYGYSERAEYELRRGETGEFEVQQRTTEQSDGEG